MSESISFDQLLAQARTKAKISKEQVANYNELLSQEKELAEKLEDIRREKVALQILVESPMKDAIRCAQIMEVAIPASYTEFMAKVSSPRVSKEGAKAPIDRGSKWAFTMVGKLSRTCNLSYGCWNYTVNCNGLGKGGRYHVVEFQALVKEQIGKGLEEIRLGETNMVSLPNGKTLTFQKLEE